MRSISIDAYVANFRYGARVLARAPWYTATVVLTLALGIGANSAMFSTVDAVILRPLPFPDSGRLVQLGEIHPTGEETGVALGRLEDWNRLSSTFEAISGYYTTDVSDTSGELPERMRMAIVTPRFQDVWGVAPALGPGLAPRARRLGEPPTALLADRYWRRRFGGNTNLSELAVRAEGQAGAVLGVMPASFQFPDPQVEVWSPAAMDAPWLTDRRPGSAYWVAVGRLKPGVSLEQAYADLAAVQAGLGQQYPETDRGIDIRMVPLKDVVVGDVGRSLWLLFGAVSILLLIACTNIAAMLMARATDREQDLAVRLTLGASRGVIVAQILAEAALLAFAGALLGLGLAAVVVKMLAAALAEELPRVAEVSIDVRDVGYVIACAVLVTLVCGLIPAIRSVRGKKALSQSARTRFAPRHAIQWALVGIQVTLSVTLLTGAGLLSRSFEMLSRVQPGFDPAGVLAFRVTGRWAESYNYDRVLQRINGWLDELRTLPGVTAATTAQWLPGVAGESVATVEFTHVGGAVEDVLGEGRNVDPLYFETMRLPLFAGELCRKPTDNAARTTRMEAMVNRAFAERYFPPGRSILGAELSGEASQGFAASPVVRVVGVVENARESGLEREPVPTVYVCDAAPNPFPWFLVRTAGGSEAMAGAIRAKIHELQPLESVYDLVPLDERIDEAYSQNRLRTWLLAMFAGTALLLACVGIYGTLSYVVTQCRREVGLRVALGARSANIVAQFLMKALRIVVAGCVGGLALALAATRLISGMLYGVSSTDPVTFAAVATTVIAVAALAALLPAMRAASVEPMRVLREE